ncbi:MAG TPA: flavodoxin family protein [Allosphingosinicella sp.]|jgi:multimeric flavodoxin WrbA|uniref:flavodoxin family protein n=1 Tax=Allosphingosinicella sp. TaxID=2823234 RepID=UPI002F276182
MKALFLSCTLKASLAPSKTEALAQVLVRQFEEEGITSEIVRLADYNVKPGVSSDEGEGDDWPFIRGKIVAADILVMGTPTWLGQHSSICQRALERMDAMLSETAEDGRPIAFDKVGGIVITGNEDGAHHIVACVSQPLIDIGFTMPANCWTYWHLGPGPGPDYLETDQAHDYSDRLARNAARNMAAVARALKASPLPQQETSG